MHRLFFVSWAGVVLLALVLPVAIPYAIWPPRGGAHDNDIVAECGRRAEQDAARETPFVWMALSNDVQLCERNEAGVLVYRATVQARGAYGIPYASGSVGLRDIQHLREDGGVTLCLVALLAGAGLVSVPFGFALLRRYFNMTRPLPA